MQDIVVIKDGQKFKVSNVIKEGGIFVVILFFWVFPIVIVITDTSESDGTNVVNFYF